MAVCLSAKSSAQASCTVAVPVDKSKQDAEYPTEPSQTRVKYPPIPGNEKSRPLCIRIQKNQRGRNKTKLGRPLGGSHPEMTGPCKVVAKNTSTKARHSEVFAFVKGAIIFSHFALLPHDAQICFPTNHSTPPTPTGASPERNNQTRNPIAAIRAPNK
jgi:hypothetical protein